MDAVDYGANLTFDEDGMFEEDVSDIPGDLRVGNSVRPVFLARWGPSGASRVFS